MSCVHSWFATIGKEGQRLSTRVVSSELLFAACLLFPSGWMRCSVAVMRTNHHLPGSRESSARKRPASIWLSLFSQRSGVEQSGAEYLDTRAFLPWLLVF